RQMPKWPAYPLATDPALMRATQVCLAATGIEVLDIELARISPSEDPRDFERFFEAGGELGARHALTQHPALARHPRPYPQNRPVSTALGDGPAALSHH